MTHPLDTGVHQAVPTDGRTDDRSWGAFSDDPPWLLDRGAIAWLHGIDPLRAAARAEVPKLTMPSRWPPGPRVARVAARLVAAVGPWFARRRLGWLDDAAASRADLSLRLRRAAEDLGSTYIKLGLKAAP